MCLANQVLLFEIEQARPRNLYLQAMSASVIIIFCSLHHWK